MEAMRITVFGGTGFIGRRLVARLSEPGHWVRVAVRHPDRRPSVPAGSEERLELVQADLLDVASVRRAVMNADLVINLVGAVSLPTARAYFALHERGARHVAESAAAAGVPRLAHISALGIAEDAPSAADRSKAAGEGAVRDVFPTASLIRPSLVYGEDDHFLSRIERMSRISPVVPLIGSQTQVQPVYVADLVEALAHLAQNPDKDGRIVQAAGPRVHSLRGVVELLLAALGRNRLVLAVPQGAARSLARLLERLPHAPLNRDLVDLMRTDKIAVPGLPGLESLGVTPRPLEDWLAQRQP